MVEEKDPLEQVIKALIDRDFEGTVGEDHPLRNVKQKTDVVRNQVINLSAAVNTLLRAGLKPEEITQLVQEELKGRNYAGTFPPLPASKFQR